MSILQCIVGEVADAVNRIRQLAEQVELEIQGPLTDGVERLRGERLWIGRGADAFYEEFDTRVKQEVMAIIAAFLGLNLNVERAENVIINADQDVAAKANSLREIYEQIHI